MKIGTSYSLCILDIFQGKIKIDDILVIVTSTHFDPTIEEQWKNIWNAYVQRGTWRTIESYEDQVLKLTLALYNSGKIHQPRKFGAHVWPSYDQHWYDLILTDEVKNDNPAVKNAWDHYKILANLV